MSAIQINYSRADADRRMRLLEIADGVLSTAKMLEEWVQFGSKPDTAAAPQLKVTLAPTDATTFTMPGTERPPDLTIPPHLDRRA